MSIRHHYRLAKLGWADRLGSSSTLVSLQILGRYPVRVQAELKDATVAMHRALVRTGYENPCDYIGSYLVRPIAGVDPPMWSAHAYGCAIDLDYGGSNPASPPHPDIDKNPHVHRRIYRGDRGFGLEWQILEHQVDAIEGLRTGNGKRVWRWLGWAIGDTMHFEAACSPEDLATGIIEEEDQMLTHFTPGIQHPAFEEIVWIVYLIDTDGAPIDPAWYSWELLEKAYGPDQDPPALVTLERLEHIAEILELSDERTEQLVERGLYRFGKEVAELRRRAVRTQ